MSTSALNLRDRHSNTPRLARSSAGMRQPILRRIRSGLLRSPNRRLRELSPGALRAVLLLVFFGVTFASASWTAESQGVPSDLRKTAVDLPRVPRQEIFVPELRLQRHGILPGQGIGGRKSWLLDLNQRDEAVRGRAHAQRDCEQRLRHPTLSSCSESRKAGSRT